MMTSSPFLRPSAQPNVGAHRGRVPSGPGPILAGNQGAGDLEPPRSTLRPPQDGRCRRCFLRGTRARNFTPHRPPQVASLAYLPMFCKNP